MKIVVRNAEGTEDCYVQVKDFLFLGYVLRNLKLAERYFYFRRKNFDSHEFVKVTNEKLKTIFIDSETIIDLPLYLKDTPLYLSSNILAINFGIESEIERKKARYVTSDLRDIIAFKKGELSYQIPVIPDYRIHFENRDLGLVFSSTIFDGYYLMRRTNGQPIAEINFESFLHDSIREVYDIDYPDYSIEEKNCKIIDEGSIFILKIETKKKPKQKKCFLEKVKKTH